MDPRLIKRGKLRSKIGRKSCRRQTIDKGQCGSSPGDFSSETLSSSSPLKPDVAVKRTRRKKIRCTQEFNQLDSSVTSQDSDVSNKCEKLVKVRRPKDAYFLPVITNVTGDSSGGKENMLPDIFSASIMTPGISTRCRKLKKTPKNRTDNSNDVKKAVKHLKNRKKQSSEDSEESSKSKDSVDDENLEVEIKPKKKRNEVLNDVENRSSGDRVKRLKRLLAGNSAPTSEEKLPEKATPLKKRSSVTKESKRRTTRGLRKRSRSTDLFVQFVEKHNIDNKVSSDLDTEDAQEVRKSVRFAEASEESNIRRSMFDVDKCSESIRLLNEVSAEDPKVNEAASEMEVSLSSHPEDFVDNTSKSLFDSGENNKLNSTFEVTSPQYVSHASASMKETLDDSLPSPIQGGSLKNSMKPNVTDENPTEHSVSSRMATPKPSYESKNVLSRNRSQITIREPLIIDLTTPLNVKLNSSSSEKNVESRKLQRQSTFSIISTGDTRRDKSVDSMPDNNPKGSDLKEKARSTSTVHINGEELDDNSENKTNVTKSSTPFNGRSRKNSNIIDTRNNSIREHSPRIKKLTSSTELTKSATPKPNRIKKFSNEKNSQNDVEYFSPIVAKSPTTKPVDTSRVTKRKQWDKSRISMSFIDSSVDINNVSAPWANDTLNTTFGISKFSDSVILDNLESTGKRNRNDEIPPSNSSTPLPQPKRHVSFKEKSVGINETKDSGKSSSKQAVKVQRKKMPNFALIHQRAYDKLENLKEMSERKAQRAKLLLSGCKPDAPVDTNACGKSQKFLQFSPARPKLPAKTKSEKEIVLHSSNVSISKVKNISPSKSNPKVASMVNRFMKFASVEKKDLKAKPSRIPTKLPDNVAAEKKGFTRYGFKVGSREVNATSKAEQMKAIASKTKVVKNTVDERRKAVQGVRTNRRFELLMNMRKK